MTTAVATTAANKVVPEVLMDMSGVSSKRCGTLPGVCRILKRMLRDRTAAGL
jgi:hypothetical protein